MNSLFSSTTGWISVRFRNSKAAVSPAGPAPMIIARFCFDCAMQNMGETRPRTPNCAVGTWYLTLDKNERDCQQFRHVRLWAGTDLRTIQLRMGHERLEDTILYLHLSQTHLHTAVNPLDQFTLREQRRIGTDESATVRGGRYHPQPRQHTLAPVRY